MAAVLVHLILYKLPCEPRCCCLSLSPVGGQGGKPGASLGANAGCCVCTCSPSLYVFMYSQYMWPWAAFCGPLLYNAALSATPGQRVHVSGSVRGCVRVIWAWNSSQGLYALQGCEGVCMPRCPAAGMRPCHGTCGPASASQMYSCQGVGPGPLALPSIDAGECLMPYHIRDQLVGVAGGTQTSVACTRQHAYCEHCEEHGLSMAVCCGATPRHAGVDCVLDRAAAAVALHEATWHVHL